MLGSLSGTSGLLLLLYKYISFVVLATVSQLVSSSSRSISHQTNQILLLLAREQAGPLYPSSLAPPLTPPPHPTNQPHLLSRCQLLRHLHNNSTKIKTATTTHPLPEQTLPSCLNLRVLTDRCIWTPIRTLRGYRWVWKHTGLMRESLCGTGRRDGWLQEGSDDENVMRRKGGGGEEIWWGGDGLGNGWRVEGQHSLVASGIEMSNDINSLSLASLVSLYSLQLCMLFSFSEFLHLLVLTSFRFSRSRLLLPRCNISPSCLDLPKLGRTSSIFIKDRNSEFRVRILSFRTLDPAQGGKTPANIPKSRRYQLLHSTYISSSSPFRLFTTRLALWSCNKKYIELSNLNHPPARRIQL